jgi:hypothetical protein
MSYFKPRLFLPMVKLLPLWALPQKVITVLVDPSSKFLLLKKLQKLPRTFCLINDVPQRKILIQFGIKN